MHILVINAGSSSLKYQFFNMDNHEVLAKGICERIGFGGHMRHSVAGKVVFESDVEMPDHSVAVEHVLKELTNSEYGVIADMGMVDAVGHRVLHGGSKFSGSMVVTPEVEAAIEECIPLGPLHNPANLMGIRACQKVMPGVPQVAVFDTAFHQSMPEQSYLYAIPYEYYEKYGIRKYGFHGTSHRYVSARCAELFGKPAEELKIVTCHLGNGSSVAAVKNGKCFDTSMGLTPLDGLVMGTRSGSIDPAVVGVIAERTGASASEVVDILNKKSGLLAVSGISGDYRDVSAADEAGNHRAHIAREMLFQSIKRYIGAYAAEMGGIDALVFTAGIGENNAYLRQRVADGLEFMGIGVDPAKNEGRGDDREVTAEGARVRTFVISTDEELMIALDAQELTSK
ncbi:MAG: acetate kinase [Clostridiaceae bacterium]|nr:acetate kinase [Clostridiaceae bacterium]MDD6273891.1 acetate kinase [Clostridiaceae bacterium]